MAQVRGLRRGYLPRPPATGHGDGPGSRFPCAVRVQGLLDGAGDRAYLNDGGTMIEFDYTRIAAGACGCDPTAQPKPHMCDWHKMEQLTQRLASAARRLDRVSEIAFEGRANTANKYHQETYSSIYDLSKTPV